MTPTKYLLTNFPHLGVAKTKTSPKRLPLVHPYYFLCTLEAPTLCSITSGRENKHHYWGQTSCVKLTNGQSISLLNILITLLGTKLSERNWSQRRWKKLRSQHNLVFSLTTWPGWNWTVSEVRSARRQSIPSRPMSGKTSSKAVCCLELSGNEDHCRAKMVPNKETQIES